MFYTKCFFWLVILIGISGCSTSRKIYSDSIDRQGVDMVVMHNNSKHAYFKDPKSLEKFCASRGSDSTDVSEQGISFGLTSLGQSDSIGEQSGTGAIALGGRSPAVLITRELMFRACELTLNINTDDDETVEIYKMFLDYILKIVKNEHDSGSTTESVTLSNDSNTQESDEDDQDEDSDDN